MLLILVRIIFEQLLISLLIFQVGILEVFVLLFHAVFQVFEIVNRVKILVLKIRLVKRILIILWICFMTHWTFLVF